MTEATTDTRRLPSYRAGEVDVPFVIAGTYEAIERDTYWEEHSHPTHELLWNERGASSATIGPRTWTITRSIGLWVPAGVPHSGWMPAGTWSRAVQFSIDDVQPVSENPVAIDVSPMLRLLLDRLSTETLSSQSRSTTEAMVFDVLEPAGREVLLRIPQSIRLAPIVEAIRSCPGDPTTLQQWASRLNLSARTVTRLFVVETGLSFSKWVAVARAQHAIELLARGDAIDDVAVAVGFGSTSAFGTAFRRVIGVSPGHFRAV